MTKKTNSIDKIRILKGNKYPRNWFISYCGNKQKSILNGRTIRQANEDIVELFKNTTNEELLKEYHEQLLCINMGTLLRVIKSERTGGSYFDDMLQECSIKLREAIERYDKSRNVLFNQFLKHFLRNAMYKFYHNETKIIRVPLTAIYKEKIKAPEVHTIKGDKCHSYKPYTSMMEVREELDKLLNKLSPKTESLVRQHYLKDISWEDLAARDNRSSSGLRQSVYNEIWALRKKLATPVTADAGSRI